jgi:hypothetical protein
MRGRFLNRLDLETSDEVVRLLEAFTVLSLRRSPGPVAREHT